MERLYLDPIERPRGLFTRLAYRIARRQYGKVITPLKVIYARKPGLVLIAQAMTWMLDRGLALDPDVRLLVMAHVARLNGCAFCQDLNLARALGAQIGPERFRALPEYRTSDLFTERERAALAFAEEATEHKRVGEATFAALRAHFSETEIVELTWVNAVENYYNLQAAVLGIGSDELAAEQGGRP